MVHIKLHRVGESTANKPTFPHGYTDDQGRVRISTYTDGDGAPTGKYQCTFELREYDMLSRSFSGPDKLTGKYSDPTKSTVVIEVGPDLPNDLGTVGLSLKSTK